MNTDSRIFVAGGTGMVGAAIIQRLLDGGYAKHRHELLQPATGETKTTRVRSQRLDLTRQADVEAFFAQEKPDCVFLAAAKVGGILANSTYKADFIYRNLMIASNVIHSAYQYGTKKLLNLGSSCHLPQARASAAEGGAPAGRHARADERAVCDRQDRGDQALQVL